MKDDEKVEITETEQQLEGANNLHPEPNKSRKNVAAVLAVLLLVIVVIVIKIVFCGDSEPSDDGLFGDETQIGETTAYVTQAGIAEIPSETTDVTTEFAEIEETTAEIFHEKPEDVESLNPHLADTNFLSPGVIKPQEKPVELPDLSDNNSAAVVGRVKPHFTSVNFGGGNLGTGMSVSSFISSTCGVWQIDESRIDGVLQPGHETYVYLHSDYWSQYKASPDVTGNNGDVIVFVRNTSGTALSLADCEIWKYSISYGDYGLDKFTQRPEVNYHGLTWGMSIENAAEIINFTDFGINRLSYPRQYEFSVQTGLKISLQFDESGRFCGISVTRL